MTKTLTARFEIIAAAVEPMKEFGIAKAVAYMERRVEYVLGEIAEKGQSAFPMPKSNQSREAYLSQNARWQFAQRITKSGQRDQRGIEALLAETEMSAAMAYDAYCQKLDYKIGGEVASASASQVDVWNDSNLKITRPDGSVEVWNTKVITNYSVYGLAFNQFPTRQVKARGRKA
jgi:hypothetical protein